MIWLICFHLRNGGYRKSAYYDYYGFLTSVHPINFGVFLMSQSLAMVLETDKTVQIL